ncbi:MAG: response regulator [Paracoccaceae bacterium]|nr:response regulator [Paracoccaceae bacterium]
MNVLIVESDAELAGLWQRHLQRSGATVSVALDQDAAVLALQKAMPDVIVLDLFLDQGSAIAVADYASYRRPETRVVFVTNTTFFSDGSIFNHIPNACAYLEAQTPPEDLAAIVEHYGRGTS